MVAYTIVMSYQIYKAHEMNNTTGQYDNFIDIK